MVKKRVSPAKGKKLEKDPPGFMIVKIILWALLAAVMFVPFVLIHITVSIRDAAHWAQSKRDQRRKVAEQD